MCALYWEVKRKDENTNKHNAETVVGRKVSGNSVCRSASILSVSAPRPRVSQLKLSMTLKTTRRVVEFFHFCIKGA